MIWIIIFILVILIAVLFSSVLRNEFSSLLCNEERRGGEELKIVKRNYADYHKIEKINFEPLYSRILSPNAHSEQFFRVHSREILILKLGQRKLFFNELELYNAISSFFPPKAEKSVVVIYAGSAPGIHSTLLAELFPNWQFHFYDMNPFFEKLRDYKNIRLYHQYFTNEDCEKQKNANNDAYIVFLSDIRSGEDEDSVERDMAMQKKWVEILQPDACMLKFRLRWIPASFTEYFDGEIYTQPRIGFSSTETRLVFFKNEMHPFFKMKTYDTELYNNQLFYFQRHNRNAFHDFNLNNFLNITSFFSAFGRKESDIFPELSKKIKGLCHCNDCWSEIKICFDFLTQRNKSIPQISDIIDLMQKIGDHTKSTLDAPPHNLLVNERDINKRMDLLEKLSVKNKEKIIEKLVEQKKERYVF